MKKMNVWKRTLAGLMALLVVAGATPMTGMQTMFEKPSIVANAATLTSASHDWSEDYDITDDATISGGTIEGMVGALEGETQSMP